MVEREVWKRNSREKMWWESRQGSRRRTSSVKEVESEEERMRLTALKRDILDKRENQDSQCW
jgi:hypothetical protein